MPTGAISAPSRRVSSPPSHWPSRREGPGLAKLSQGRVETVRAKTDSALRARCLPWSSTAKRARAVSLTCQTMISSALIGEPSRSVAAIVSLRQWRIRTSIGRRLNSGFTHSRPERRTVPR